MALNPPIQAIPIQETEKNEHLQRFLTSLPTFGSGGGGLVSNKAVTNTSHRGDREMEAAQRRLERKTRRREQAAILKPRPPTPPFPNSQADIRDKSEERRERDLATDQEWWDNYRAKKQALAGPSTSKPPEDVNTYNVMEKETDVEKEMDRQYARQEQRQKRIPKGKGRTSERGIKIPGMEIIDSYKPITTALGPRITMQSQPGKKGMFAHGKSSNPSVIRALEGTKTINPRPTSQSTSGPSHRLTLESSPNAKEKSDWRDQWRRQSSKVIPKKDAGENRTEIGNDRLPPPGYTNSTSWPSTRLSSSSRPSRHRSGEMGPPPLPPVESPYRSHNRDDWLEGYSFRLPSLPVEPARHDHQCRNEENLRGETFTPNYPASADLVYHPLHPILQETYHKPERDRGDAYMAMMESACVQEGEYEGYPPMYQDPNQAQVQNYDHRHIYRRHDPCPSHHPDPYSHPSQTYNPDPNNFGSLPEPQDPRPLFHPPDLCHTYSHPGHAQSQEQDQVEAQNVNRQRINDENDVPELKGFWKSAQPTPLLPPNQISASLNLIPTHNPIPHRNPGSALPYHPSSPHHVESRTRPPPRGPFQYHPNPLGNRNSSHERDTHSFPPQAYMTPQLPFNQFHQSDLVTPTPAPKSTGVFMNNIHSQPHGYLDSSMIGDQPDMDRLGRAEGEVAMAGPGNMTENTEMNIDRARDRDRDRDMDMEIEEYGASKDEWKSLWSSKKP